MLLCDHRFADFACRPGVVRDRGVVHAVRLTIEQNRAESLILPKLEAIGRVVNIGDMFMIRRSGISGILLRPGKI